jgi:hypothetical protein
MSMTTLKGSAGTANQMTVTCITTSCQTPQKIVEIGNACQQRRRWFSSLSSFKITCGVIKWYQYLVKTLEQTKWWIYSGNVPRGLAFAIPSMEAHRYATVTQPKPKKKIALEELLRQYLAIKGKVTMHLYKEPSIDTDLRTHRCCDKVQYPGRAHTYRIL